MQMTTPPWNWKGAGVERPSHLRRWEQGPAQTLLHPERFPPVGRLSGGWRAAAPLKEPP